MTDAGLKHLLRLTKLEYLDIGSCPITDGGLALLRELKLLKGLRLQSPTCTADGVAALREALPECEISYRNPPQPGTVIRRDFLASPATVSQQPKKQAAASLPAREWTDRSGPHPIRASLERDAGEFVVLKGDDGKSQRIAKAKLSDGDREYVEAKRGGLVLVQIAEPSHKWSSPGVVFKQAGDIAYVAAFGFASGRCSIVPEAGRRPFPQKWSHATRALVTVLADPLKKCPNRSTSPTRSISRICRPRFPSTYRTFWRAARELPIFPACTLQSKLPFSSATAPALWHPLRNRASAISNGGSCGTSQDGLLEYLPRIPCLAVRRYLDSPSRHRCIWSHLSQSGTILTDRESVRPR